MSRVSEGTTLLELMVALAVTGISVSAAYGIAGQIHRTAADDPVMEAAFNAAELRRRLTVWFGNARVDSDGTVYPFTGTGAAAPQVQSLISSAAPYTPREVIARLFVEGDPGAAEAGLIIQLMDPLDRTSRRIQLERDVAGMKVRYLIQSGHGAVWTDVYTSAFEPPRAIEVTLLPRTGARLHRLLELPVLIPVGLK